MKIAIAWAAGHEMPWGEWTRRESTTNRGQAALRQAASSGFTAKSLIRQAHELAPSRLRRNTLKPTLGLSCLDSPSRPGGGLDSPSQDRRTFNPDQPA
jgi:hypothetical protein